MLSTIVAIYSIYILVSIYVSVMQIGYITQTKTKSPILLKASEFLKAANYAVANERVKIATAIVDLVLFIFWISLGISYLNELFITYSESLKAILIVLSFIVVNGVISLPFSIYSKFVVDEKFGFNKSSFALFVKDTLISTIITLIVGAAIVAVIEYIMSSSELWWFYSFLFIFGVIIAINMLFPTVRALFFDKLTPLDDEELNSKITELMDTTGFQSQGVFVSDASKRDGRLNAYFGGLGKSKRVVLFDTLVEKLTQQELLAVLGHELGHFAHGDLYKNIAMIGSMMFGMFAIFGNIDDSLFLEMGIEQSPANVMLLFMLFMPVLGFIMMPIMGIVSRHNEYEADKTGSELGGKLYLAEALQKLVSENKSYPLSHPIYIFFHYTHPPVLERLKELGVTFSGQDDK